LNPKEIGVDYIVVCPLPQGEITVEYKGGQSSITLPEGVEEMA